MKNKIYKVLFLVSFMVGVMTTGIVESDAANNLLMPLNVSMTSNSEASVTISWNSVNFANAYQIYRYDNSTKKYQYLASTTKTSYTNLNLESGRIYKYKIRAYNTVNRMNQYGFYSNEITAVTKVFVPDNLKILDRGENEVKFSWSEVSGAEGYVIYKYNVLTQEFEECAQTVETSYILSGLETGSHEFIKVKAYNLFDDRKIYSDYSEELDITTKFDKVTNLKIDSSTLDSVTISWDKKDGAEKYNVYIYNVKNKKYELAGSTQEFNYTFSKLKQASTYKIKVNAVKCIDKEQIIGTGNVTDIYTNPSKPNKFVKKSSNHNSATFAWSKVPNATGYLVVIYDENDNEIFSEKIKETTYKYNSENSKVTIKANVCACYEPNEEVTLYSDYTDKRNAQLDISKVKNVIINYEDKNVFNVEWEKQPGITTYNVYVAMTKDEVKKDNEKSDKNKNSENNTNVTSTTTEDTDVIQGEETGVEIIPSFTIEGEGNYYLYRTVDTNMLEIQKLKGYTITGIRVAAYWENLANIFEGEYSSKAGYFNKLTTKAAITMDTLYTFNISYSAVKGATGYQIERKTSKGYEVVGKSKITRYYDKGLDNFTTYKYRVRAYKTLDNGKTVYSKYSPVVSYNTGAYGIDVSKWNGKIDWKKVKGSGVDFAIIRATTYAKNGMYSTNLVEDDNFKENIQGALENDIKVGIYVYSYADSVNEAKNEAIAVKEIVKDYKLTYPVSYDFEQGERADRSMKTENTNMIKTFCDSMISSGYKTNLYIGASYLMCYVDYDEVKKYGIWVARYYDSDVKIDYSKDNITMKNLLNKGYNRGSAYSKIDDVMMWQFSENGRVDGISTRVDLNFSYINYN